MWMGFYTDCCLTVELFCTRVPVQVICCNNFGQSLMPHTRIRPIQVFMPYAPNMCAHMDACTHMYTWTHTCTNIHNIAVQYVYMTTQSNLTYIAVCTVRATATSRTFLRAAKWLLCCCIASMYTAEAGTAKKCFCWEKEREREEGVLTSLIKPNNRQLKVYSFTLFRRWFLSW